MRRVGNWWRLAGVALVALAGCQTSSYSDLRPNRPDDYKLPPEGLYAGDPTYPKEMLNQVGPRKSTNPLDAPPAMGGGRPGGMGMGQP